MSPDIRSALHHAAPEPELHLDENDLARRSRRVGIARAAAAVSMIAALLGGGVFTAGVFRDADQEPIPPATHGNEAPEVPKGKRYEIASGTFGDDWLHNPGKDWRFLVWGEGHISCWQIAVEGEPRNRSLGCGAPSAKTEEEGEEPLDFTTWFFTQSSDPERFWFVAGAVNDQVATIEFQPSGSEAVELNLIEPPAQSGALDRYYVATLGEFVEGQIVALDHAGEVIDSEHVCAPACQEAREADQAAEVAVWEALPTEETDMAAAFANMAVGAVGLMNGFDVSYGYEDLEIVGDRYVAHFNVSQCEPPSGKDGSYRCDEDLGPARVSVEVDGGRLKVVDAQGPMTDEQRASLLHYPGSGEEFGPHWNQIGGAVVREQDRRKWGVSLYLVWMGNLPPPVSDYGSLCDWAVYDSQGDRVFESSRPFPMDVREGEVFRVSGIFSGLEADVEDAVDVVAECDDPRANYQREEP